ncbi:MAG: nucleotidyltransferase family protein [Clostridia bacterium]|nr:nucleotidyltransferase family protein [Clostridia bacterium]
MNENHNVMLSLIKASLFQKPLELPDTVNWQAVFHEMKAHTISALAVEAVCGIEGLDESVKALWVNHAQKNLHRYYRILHEQQVAIRILENAGLHPAVLKGASAARYYPNPVYRAMGDVDLFLPGERAIQAVSILKDHGYQGKHENIQNPRHRTVEKNSVIFELHASFSMLADEEKAQALDCMLHEGLKALRFHEISGYPFPCFSDLLYGLICLDHINHHMLSGIGLRQILDWTVYVDKVLDDAFWTNEFQPLVQKFGYEKFAKVLTRTGQLYFGLQTEGRSWCSQVDRADCDQLLAFVLESGNFGRKQGKKSSAITVLSGFKGVKSTFQSLQKNGCVNFAGAIEKFPFLKPFAWLLRLVRLAVLTVRRRLNPSAIWASYKESRRRIELCRAVGVIDAKPDDD